VRPADQPTYQISESRTGRLGYDNCWVLNPLDNKRVTSQISLWSETSGIRSVQALIQDGKPYTNETHRLDILTNQPAVQIYTGNWLDTPRKDAHGGPSKTYSQWSAVAIEQQGYVDAINTPEWGVDQIRAFFAFAC
jgi:aldose 1-epimerase